METFDSLWTKVGIRVARGGSLNVGDLRAIYHNLDIGHMKPDYLPDESTTTGSESERKYAIFSLAQRLWAITPQNWLARENTWLS